MIYWQMHKTSALHKPGLREQGEKEAKRTRREREKELVAQGQQRKGVGCFAAWLLPERK